MVDIRFHPYAGSKSVGELLEGSAHDAEASAETRELVIEGAAEIEAAEVGQIVLAASSEYVHLLENCKASVAIVNQKTQSAVPDGMPSIVAKNAHGLFIDILEQLYPASTRHIWAESARPSEDTWVESGVTIAPSAHVGVGAEIGHGTIIGANATIGAGVTIGRDCLIGPNVSIECAYIGNNVVIQAGTRIGCEGFGWLEQGQSNRKIPQLGRVIIQDSVEIGANSTIDRGALGDTVIGELTKIDNLVQIGHNCRIGRSCLIAAMSGLSGTTVLGDGVLMGGGSGTSGHMHIGSHSIVHGRAAVTKDWPEGSKLAGAPAQDIKAFWKELAVVRRLVKGDGA